MDALLRQLEHFLEILQVRRIDTVYIGGGTPNSLDPWVFEKLISGISRNLQPLGPGEWTVELNPEFVEEDQLRLLRDRGVNRLSVGIQSFSPDALQLLGRRATVEQNRGALEVIRRIWPGDWNLDLISLLPGQDAVAALEDLGKALSFHSPHLSLYGLGIEERTPLYALYQRGGIRPLEQNVQADMLLRMWDLLDRSGYRHYEVSNFALPGHESRHNRHYWRLDPYLGLGPGAVSTLASNRHPLRLSGTPDIEGYIRSYRNAVQADSLELLGYEVEEIEYWDFMFEYLMMGLRTRPGVEPERFEEIFDVPLLDILSPGRGSEFGELLSVDSSGSLYLDDPAMLTLDRLLSQVWDVLQSFKQERPSRIETGEATLKWYSR